MTTPNSRQRQNVRRLLFVCRPSSKSKFIISLMSHTLLSIALSIHYALKSMVGYVFFFLADNGLNPVWWVKFDVDVINPPLAYLRFVVFDEDMFGEPNFIGHAIFPMCSLKTGSYFV